VLWLEDATMSPETSSAGPKGAAREQDLQRSLGRAIRRRRRLVEMTQQKLAARCGVSFQQIQKYEAGEASIYAARLWTIARALDVSVGYFFEGALPSPASTAQ
jgi:transcriptional regulator with XRE-family HTH domain